MATRAPRACTRRPCSFDAARRPRDGEPLGRAWRRQGAEIARLAPFERRGESPPQGFGLERSELRNGRPAGPRARPMGDLEPPWPALHRTAQRHTSGSYRARAPLARPTPGSARYTGGSRQTNWRPRRRRACLEVGLRPAAPPGRGCGPRRARSSQTSRSPNLQEQT